MDSKKKILIRCVSANRPTAFSPSFMNSTQFSTPRPVTNSLRLGSCTLPLLFGIWYRWNQWTPVVSDCLARGGARVAVLGSLARSWWCALGTRSSTSTAFRVPLAECFWQRETPSGCAAVHPSAGLTTRWTPPSAHPCRPTPGAPEDGPARGSCPVRSRRNTPSHSLIKHLVSTHLPSLNILVPCVINVLPHYW